MSDPDWPIRPDTVYLNHGSFGPTPAPVLAERERWSRELASQPMDFFVRRLEGELDAATDALGRFVGADAAGIVPIPNSTSGMNLVAANLPLAAGDEVLLTSHEYGAVFRLWKHWAEPAGAQVTTAPIRAALDDAEAVAADVLAAITPRTKVLIVSHVASKSAAVLPVRRICEGAKARGVPVAVDGPHAIAALPLERPGEGIADLGCDWYATGCHKWLSAPFGSGFLWVAPRRRQGFEPLVTSWGRSLSGRPADWRDEFRWPGTPDPAPFLAIPAAIRFLEAAGLDRFRTRSAELARDAVARLNALTGLPPLPDFGLPMAAATLPDPPGGLPKRDDGDSNALQRALWERHGIEIPVVRRGPRRQIRVSCHLYTTPEHVDRLIAAVEEELNRGT
ncbi:aminotransferase class V-fold PLP-dependent enzyme [Alienimonas californiensis]|uniref:Isopenicillin N epimerase n=1 Tax=Alienimonas californiensis TaxID=2527989 RepID=A0A517P8K4_9PLAN|nr:aminotransferase class V-fold PLP-dependent enzyme [Alienimonas californiensis]QDT15701.1 Isopenicillin N epimerase [Alienimonas californiensis]